MKIVRDSKFRHVFGEASKERYDDIRLSSKATESAGIQGNAKYFVFPWDSGGGGSLAVIPTTQYGRQKRDIPLITGHSGPILDFEFSPFNDQMLASCSEDMTVKIWNIPEEGLKSHMKEPLASLEGHLKKVSHCTFNPCAEGILATTAFDMTLKGWNLQEQDEAFSVTVPDQVWSMKWNYFGHLLAATFKDKKLRLLDPRTGTWIHEGKCHDGVKATKVAWIGSTTTPNDMQRILTTGFSQQADRQLAAWDLRKLNGDQTEPLTTVQLDPGTGALFPYFDEGTRMLFIWGKGDCNVRFWEVTDDDPYMHFISTFSTTSPQKGFAWLPKRCVNVMKHEAIRALKLESTGVQPVSFKVPRKAEVFQDDIFPDCPSGLPAVSAEEWVAGAGKTYMPPLQSLDPSKQAGQGAAAARRSTTTTGMVSVKELKAQLAEAQKRIQELEAENTSLKQELASLKGK